MRQKDNLYTISWEADFDYQICEPQGDDNPNEATQPVDNNASSVAGVHVIDDNALNSDHDNVERPKPATSGDETTLRDENDVTTRDDC